MRRPAGFPWNVAVLLVAACGSEHEPATAPADPASYSETIPGTGISFAMVAIPGGTFAMGSPPSEAGHGADEAPLRRVQISPFWIGKHEVTWDEFELWATSRDLAASTDPDLASRVDGISRPTPPYTDMTFGMGAGRHPAICMTHHAARTYCAWLSAATGHPYRLPTEAEWEYACRAGTTTAYGFGDDPGALADHAWFAPNSGGRYHQVGAKQPNRWGLHDMHGNVSEWVVDQLLPYSAPAGEPVVDPVVEPTTAFARAVRGGSWQDPAPLLRSAARRGSDPAWQQRDPQVPKSIWYLTDAPFVGFRLARSSAP